MTDTPRTFQLWQTTALKVAAVYVVAAGLWIALSDQLLVQLATDPATLSRWQTVKGWLFVLATGGILFAYLHRCLRRHAETFTQLTTLFDSIPAIVYAADLTNYQLLFVNRFARERFGADWQGKSCFEYLQQGQQDVCEFCTNAQLLAAGEPGPPVSWEFRNTKDGRWYHCLDKAVYWPDRHLVRMEIALDITERKEMERTKEELLSAVSHEMRTPLTAITGFAELLLGDRSLAEPARRHMETILQEAEKMQDLVHTFLEVRRLKTDRARIGYERLALRRLMEQAASTCRELDDRSRVTVDCPEELLVFGNRRELTQVVRQLLANAVRFSPPDSPILLQGRLADGTVSIVCTDRGIGIPAEELERIFEPFHRLDIGDRRRARGIGLGLAMAREIVTLHGGTIHVESTPGTGSRFVVTLPAQPAAVR